MPMSMKPTAGQPGSLFPRKSSRVTFGRPPIVIEWGSSVLRIGCTEEFRPRYVLPWTSNHSPSNISERQCYAIVSPLVAQLLDQLFLNATTRRVVCVHSPYMPRLWKRALVQALINLGVPAVCFVCGMDTLPYAMGWKRALIVDVGRTEARVMAHVDGHALHDTLQVVPCGYERVVSDEYTKTATVSWDDKMELQWLDHCNPQSLMFAILKCIEACPLDDLKDVISNIFLVGGTVLGVPDLGLRLGQRLVELLKHKSSPESSAATSEEPRSVDLAMLPTNWTSLTCLASHVSVTTSTSMYHRPGLSCWIGACIWASVWHQKDIDAQIKWITPEEDKR